MQIREKKTEKIQFVLDSWLLFHNTDTWGFTSTLRARGLVDLCSEQRQINPVLEGGGRFPSLPLQFPGPGPRRCSACRSTERAQGFSERARIFDGAKKQCFREAWLGLAPSPSDQAGAFLKARDCVWNLLFPRQLDMSQRSEG